MNTKTMLPLNLGLIYFLGIGGIGMSGIAEVLFNLGYKVKGSDSKRSPITDRLESLGIEVFIGHNVTNLVSVEVVVISSAIKGKNPELKAARQKSIPIVKRAEMLAELMRLKSNIAIAGSHGKTTTTSMVAALLDGGKLDPTVINGGVIQAYGSNARLGAGDWMVVEADESDGTFTKLNPTVAVITNIDLEHLDFHKNEKNLELAFFNFLSSIPFYGFICLCTDHPRVQKLISKLEDKKVITYGLSANADVRATNIIYNNNKMNFTLSISNRRELEISSYEIEFSMIGIHNIQNALATIATGIELKIPIEKIKNTLKTFTGVQRRFQNVGNFKNTTIIDDYGHHPVEINAALAAARLLAPKSKIISIFQPHRYSRIKDLFNDFCSCFNDADYVFLLDVYPAGEEPLKGFESNDLKNGLLKYGHKNVSYIESKKALIRETLKIISPHDIIICLGAGSITKIANTLEKELHNGS